MSARRSARLQEKQNNHPKQNFHLDEGASESDHQFEGPSSTINSLKQGRKRKNRQDSEILTPSSKPKKKARTRGILSGVMDLPSDLFPEIFGHLNPIDLLNLSRTSKVLHETLMSRSSRHIWTQALANMPEIPNCPNGVSEPQFVNFLFGKGCMACGARILRMKCRHEIADSCTRLCPKCLPIHYEKIGDGSIFVHSRAYPSHIVEYLETYEGLDDNSDVYYGPSQLYISRRQDKQWTKEYRALTTAEERKDWENRIVTEYRANHAISNQISILMADRAEEEEKEEYEVEKDRKSRIIAHLRTMGWGDEVDTWRSHQFDNGKDGVPKEIQKAIKKDLTPRILKNMEPFLNRYMEERKAGRLFRERRRCLSSRARTLTAVCLPLIEKLVPASESRIKVQDVFQDQRVKGVLLDTPQGVELGPNDFAFVEGLLPEIILAWKDRVKTSMIGLIIEAMGEEYVFKVGRSAVLSLATSIFSCQGAVAPTSLKIHEIKAMGLRAAQRRWASHCQTANESVWIEDALSHSCCYRLQLPDESCKSPSDFLFDTEPWTSKLVFKEEDKNTLDHALLLCGQNPLTTTIDEMDELDPIFECVLCRRSTRGREVMNWRGVVQHFRAKHKAYRGPCAPYLSMLALVVLRGTDAQEARNLIAEACEKKIYHHELEILCVHCGHAGILAALKRHLLKEHSISNAQVGVDLQLSGKNPNCYPTDPVQLWPPYVGPVPGGEDAESLDPLYELRIKCLGVPNEEEVDIW